MTLVYKYMYRALVLIKDTVFSQRYLIITTAKCTRHVSILRSEFKFIKTPYQKLMIKT